MARPKKIKEETTAPQDGEVFAPNEIIPLDPEVIAANMPAPPPAPVFSDLAKRIAGNVGAALVHEDEYTITLEKRGYRLAANWHQPEDQLESVFARGLPQ
jgi:hypothetical protein